MLNHTYASVKNANLVDSGKKQHISNSQFPLLKENFLGEFRTELEKKKVLANLGIITDLLLEWEFIKGDIGKNETLIQELDSRTKYVSTIDDVKKTLTEGIQYLETIVGSEQDVEDEQNEQISELKTSFQNLSETLDNLQTYLDTTIETNIDDLQGIVDELVENVENITSLIKVSDVENNALVILTEDDVEEGETPGLYVPNLEPIVSKTVEDVSTLQSSVSEVQTKLETFVTKEELGGGDFDFVNQNEFDELVDDVDEIKNELTNTVKTGEDGHVDTLFVNKISKNNDEENIVISDSFLVDNNIPLDVRLVKENLDELYQLPANVCYAGMGVIVNSLSALYILRKPEEGVVINQDYISNKNNWKCPEDLVTVALTREQYENLDEINPNVFYYVYEDEITRTQEPQRSEYETEEEFNIEWNKWTDSLKTLSQEYMSAAWGVDIENKLAKKASAQSINTLIDEINKIKGDGEGPSIASLGESIEDLQTEDTNIKSRLDEILTEVDEVEQGRLVNAESEINTIKTNLDNYVTKEFIQNSENNFIFVKEETYTKDKEDFQKSLAESFETDELTTLKINLGFDVLESDDSELKYNSELIAKKSDIPEIQIMSQTDYDNLEEKNEDVFYYTYIDDNDPYVTKTDLNTLISQLQETINALGTANSELSSKINLLEAKIKELHPEE